MDKDNELQFIDTIVSNGQFIDELATKIALKMHQIEKGELEISQAQAYRIYGRADVERWVNKGLLEPCRISPGKKRYRIIDLQRLADVKQNYLL